MSKMDRDISLGAKRTQRGLVELQFALSAPYWTIAIVPESGGHVIRDTISRRTLFHADQVLWFRHRNAQGDHIYGRPNSTRYILVDDVDRTAIASMKQDGYEPTVVIETSPDNFQAWITVSDEEVSIPIATEAARILAKRFGGDPGSADALHLGRLPGLRNRKEKHRDQEGYPLAKMPLCRNVPKLATCSDDLITEAMRNLEMQRHTLPPSSPQGVCAPTTPTGDIDPSQSSMTAEEAREIYEAEFVFQKNRLGGSFPANDRSRIDFLVVQGLWKRHRHTYKKDDLAALLYHASEKAQEGGVEYVQRTVIAACRNM
jgi:hypothetical protein